jgi:hypothetical protein
LGRPSKQFNPPLFVNKAATAPPLFVNKAATAAETDKGAAADPSAKGYLFQILR